jgi:curved DNA-binding protein CbpA
MRDDYYTLLGVDPDATTDDIRLAFRTRKDALDTATDAGKADAAKLNKAWNVLSDPYQRGRYDEQRANATGDDDATADDDAAVEPAGNGARRPVARQRRSMAPPTITPPPGTRWPLPKMRLMAMAIDLLVLLAFFVGGQFAASAISKHEKPAVVHTIDRLNTDIDNANKAKDQANTDLNNAKKANNADAIASSQKRVNDLTQEIKDKTKQHDDEAAKLNGYFFGAIAASFLVGFLYLLIPSMVTGRTLGKRLQHLKVVRDDGSPLRAGDAIKRYGVIILATFAFYLFVRELGAVVVLVGVTTWMRNQNFQGWHDRLARTIVVNDAA